MSRIKMIIGAMSFLVLASCTKDRLDDAKPIEPIVESVTFNADIQAIMFNNCVTCHSGVLPSAGLDLSTYQNVRFASESGQLLGRVEDVGNPMPPVGLLSAELRAQIAKWAEDGFPEN